MPAGSPVDVRVSRKDTDIILRVGNGHLVGSDVRNRSDTATLDVGNPFD